MAARQPIIVADETFATKKAALERFKGIINKYSPGETLDFGDDIMAYCLLREFHPEGLQKIGAGVHAIGVRADGYGGKCFEVIRSDGSREDFSFYVCINGKPSHYQEVTAAARRAIADTVQAFKYESFRAGLQTCAITGEPLTWKNCDVDHAPPWTFRRILDAFLEENDVDSIKIGGAGTVTEFADSEMADRFVAFHNHLAILRLLTREANRSRRTA